MEAPAATAIVISGASSDADRVVRRSVKKGTLAAAGAVVVIAGVVTAVVASSGGSDKKAPVVAAPATAQPVATTTSATPTPTLAAAIRLSSSLVGKYNVASLVTSSEIPSEPAGTRYASVWTINKGCAATPCHLAISSSSGAHCDVIFDGSTLTFSTTESTVVQCVDSATKQVLPGQSATNVDVLRFTFAVDAAKHTLIGAATISQTGTNPTPDVTFQHPLTRSAG